MSIVSRHIVTTDELNQGWSTAGRVISARPLSQEDEISRGAMVGSHYEVITESEAPRPQAERQGGLGFSDGGKEISLPVTATISGSWLCLCGEINPSQRSGCGRCGKPIA